MTNYVIICPCCSNKYQKYFPTGKALCDFCGCLWEYRAKYEVGNTIETIKSIEKIETIGRFPNPFKE